MVRVLRRNLKDGQKANWKIILHFKAPQQYFSQDILISIISCRRQAAGGRRHGAGRNSNWNEMHNKGKCLQVIGQAIFCHEGLHMVCLEETQKHSRRNLQEIGAMLSIHKFFAWIFLCWVWDWWKTTDFPASFRSPSEWFLEACPFSGEFPFTKPRFLGRLHFVRRVSWKLTRNFLKRYRNCLKCCLSPRKLLTPFDLEMGAFLTRFSTQSVTFFSGEFPGNSPEKPTHSI